MTPGLDPSAMLRVEDLRVSFSTPRGLVRAVRGVDLVLGRAQMHAVVGESGSGKSVSMRALVGLLPRGRTQVSGRALLEGVDLLSLDEDQKVGVRGRSVGMVFQDPLRAMNPTMRVGRQLVEAVSAHGQLGKEALRTRTRELLDMVQVPSSLRVMDMFPYELSGGLRQRVMIATAIAGGARLLIADEPTTALDVSIQAGILDLFKTLQQDTGTSVILITHNISLALDYAEAVSVMYAGKVVETGSRLDLVASVRMPYSRGLLDSVPRGSQARHSRLVTMEGYPPGPTERLEGCSFANRCPWAEDMCRRREPVLGGEGDSLHRWACWKPLADQEVPA